MRNPTNVLCALAIVAVLVSGTAGADAPADQPTKLTLHARSRVLDKTAGAEKRTVAVEKTLEWDPQQTALIVCDMWDDHWCQGRPSAWRTGRPVNKLAHRRARAGLLVIHAPSTCVDFYKTRRSVPGTVGAFRQVAGPAVAGYAVGNALVLARLAARAGIADRRFGHGLRLPPKSARFAPPGRAQIAAIDIVEPDAISDDGQEVYNLPAAARHRQRADRRRAPEHVRAGTLVRHPPDGRSWARTWCWCAT